MNIGDHIQFISTRCRGLVVKVTRHADAQGRATEFVHVLCGPDANGEHGGEVTAFPRLALELSAEIL
jgi:hypothetical protein